MKPGSEVLSNSALTHADRVLEELEQISRSERSPSRFYAQLFQGLSVLFGAKQACVVAAIDVNRWQTIASTQDSHAAIAEERLQQMTSTHATLPLPRWCEWKEDSVLMGSSLLPTDWSLGGLVIELPKTSLRHDPSSSAAVAAITEKLELLEAFAELAHAYQSQHRFTRDEQQILQTRLITKSLWESKSSVDSNRVLVDGVRCLLDADRVCMLQGLDERQPSSLIAVSDNHEPQTDVRLSLALKRLDEIPFTRIPSRQQLKNFAESNGTTHAIALPIEPVSNPEMKIASNIANHFLLIEWTDLDRSCSSIPHIAEMVPWLFDAWRSKKSVRPSNRTRNLVRLFIASCCIVGGVLFFLNPTELTIHAQGILQPGEQTLVFAPTDGFVDSIPVSDGQNVLENDVVAVLSSPSLQLQLNQIDSEIALTNQRSEGLNISLNQIRPNQEQAETLASRLAGEIAELETKRANLDEQRSLIKREIDRLELRSPMEGTIIGWQMETVLENRPVKRGDMLMRIAKLDHEWQIETRVADWELGYVLDAISSSMSSNEKLFIEYTLASDAGNRGKGHFVHSSNSLFTQPDGQFLSVLIAPDSPIENPRMGASVTVSIPCGRHPRWFVWSRSIIDAAYRRFWL